jgi:hypothetical protein
MCAYVLECAPCWTVKRHNPTQCNAGGGERSWKGNCQSAGSPLARTGLVHEAAALDSSDCVASAEGAEQEARPSHAYIVRRCSSGAPLSAHLHCIFFVNYLIDL